ncbi:exodeoxyribonuclease I [Frateuria aurantia]
MTEASFFWHDYETFGADPWRDRPVQFAGIRTDLALNIIDEPVMFYGQPPLDMPPHPEACLITRITPQLAAREGVGEAEFATRVQDQLGRPGTCGVGYNSLRFDDEVTRQLLYRNFHDPYAREWEHGNARWDLIDLVRMCQALRPDGIRWPLREDGSPSFKLEHLATANALEQAQAHDALSDVRALIGLARLLRAGQPRLWDWYYALRRKQRVQSLLDPVAMTPLVHISSRYPARRHCLAIIAPLAEHPSRPGEMIVYDLSVDPRAWLDLDAASIADRIFVAQADLPEGIERVPLRTLRSNRAPAIAPLSVLRPADLDRLQLDLPRQLQHLDSLRQAPELIAKVRDIFGHAADLPPPLDPELALYSGFLPRADKPLLARVRTSPPAELASLEHAFHDPRYGELLFRYRARNWPASLSPEEQARWQAFRVARLSGRSPAANLGLADYFQRIATLRSERPAPEDQILLDQLQAWGEYLGADLPALDP